MKRMHIHVGVDDLESGIKFYSALFRAEPAKIKHDYAKWMLDDPRVNFAISTDTSAKGLNHLGIQVDKLDELEEIRNELKEANLSTYDDGEVTCCYARSQKSWIVDPAGIAWETFKTMDDKQYFGKRRNSDSGCCE